MSSIFDEFDRNRLFFSLSGEIVYLPSAFSDLEYDSMSGVLSKVIPSHKVDKNGKRIPLNSEEEGTLVPSSRKRITNKKNVILSVKNTKGGDILVRYFEADDVAPTEIRFSSMTAAIDESPETSFALSRILGDKLEVRNIMEDGTEWDPEALQNEYYADRDASDFPDRRREILLKARTDVTSKGIPLFLYAKNDDFRAFVDGEVASLLAAKKRGSLPVYSPNPLKKSFLGPYFARLLAAHFFATKYSSYLDAYRKEAKRLSSLVDSDKAPKIKNLDKGVNFLPHQVYAAAFLNTRNVALIDADPGAGKTLMMLADILDRVGTGMVNRPCIVMPNPLLGQQKIEIEAWTNNTINVIVLSTLTVSQLDPNAREGKQKRKKYLTLPGSHDAGLPEAIKLVNSAPKNTIILTSYAWLAAKSSEKDAPTPYPRIDILTNSPKDGGMGVDMVSLDESHFIRYNSKGEMANRTEAIGRLGKLVKHKRCFSGSIAPNTPEDIFLQASFLDKEVFGSIHEFRMKYGSSWSQRTGKVETWKPKALKEMKDKLGSSISLSIRKSAWITQLPRLHTTHHEVTLDDLQLDAYKGILGESIPDVLSGSYSTNNPAAVAAVIREIIKKFRFVERYAKTEQDVALADEYKKLLSSKDVFGYESQSISDSTLYPGDLAERLSSLQGSELYPRILAASSRLLKEIKASPEDAREYNRLEYEKSLDRAQKNDDVDLVTALGAEGISPGSGGKKRSKTKAIDVPEEFLVATENLAIYSDLEQFLGDPSSSHWGNFLLSGHPESFVSPKVKKIDEILEAHFSSDVHGKVLIYTNTKTVAKHLYNNIARRHSALYYDAEKQNELNRFKKDPSIEILVAVVASLTEGHNLQMANRVIYVDLPWMPGSYDQSLARAYRLPPRDKKAKSYKDVYVDILLCARTFEYTKYARLIAKMQQTRTLTSDYASASDLAQLRMNTETMASMNDSWHFSDYIKAFEDMRVADTKLSGLDAHKFKGRSGKAASGALASGENIEGHKISVPYTQADLYRSPRLESPSIVGALSPTLIRINGFWYLSFSNSQLPPPSFFRGTNSGRPYSFVEMETKALRVEKAADATKIIKSLLEAGFFDAEEAGDLLKTTRDLLRNRGTGRVRKASALVMPRRMNTEAKKKVFNIAQMDPQAVALASSVFPDDSSLVARAYLAAALSAGVVSFSLPLTDEEKTSLSALFTRRKPPLDALNRIVPLMEAVSSTPSPSPSSAVPAPVSPPPEDSSVPGLTEDNTPSSSSSAGLSSDSDSGFLPFSILRNSTPLDFDEGNKEVYIRYKGKGDVVGFKTLDGVANRTFYLLGEATAAVRNSLSAFSRRVYPGGYSIKDLPGFISLLVRSGVSDTDIEYSFGSKDTGIIEGDNEVDPDNFEDIDGGTPSPVRSDEGEEEAYEEAYEDDDEEGEGDTKVPELNIPSSDKLNMKWSVEPRQASSFSAYPEYEKLTQSIFGDE